MNNVRSTLFPESKNRSVYFDPDEIIRITEEDTKKKVSENIAAIIRNCAPLINRAYNDGLRDGLRGGGSQHE